MKMCPKQREGSMEDWDKWLSPPTLFSIAARLGFALSAFTFPVASILLFLFYYNKFPQIAVIFASLSQVLGAAAMVKITGKHPGQLKDAVTSPAGTTITGILELERAGFRGTLMSAVVAAAKRCQELSKS